ncbi:larval cuticle protein LCP-22 [Eupeodes corollae]|uniref:larval cuticle protein LCP-22 n=1 Tax=Eupeodes corollae TaxID=290404 RepID=UPI002493AD7A|nr:larval cuticle protein LCP-22 [Eupeodes corollae]
MFKLCVAIAVIGCMASLAEGQNYFGQQGARLPFYQQQQYQQIRQPFYQQNRFQPSYYSQQRPNYYNPNAYNRNFLSNYYNRPGAFLPQRVITNDGLARTIYHSKNARPDGSYEYNYQTENGISGEERNVPKSLRSGETSGNAEGSYGYTSPEGLKVVVNYQADEDGFRPVLSYGGNGAAQLLNNPEPSSVVLNRRQPLN